MSAQDIINLLLIVISIGIIFFVIIQQQESGFYSNTSNINRTRRGADKLVYNLTILFGVLFIALSITSLFV
jgi:preprotein translocase subunit SecG